MPHSIPQIDENYLGYARALLRQHQLFGGPAEESPDMDSVEDELTAYWQTLDQAQRGSLNGVGSDLNWIRRGGTPAPKSRPASEIHLSNYLVLCIASLSKKWHDTLHGLRVCSPILEPLSMALIRYKAYTELGLPEIGDVFAKFLLGR